MLGGAIGVWKLAASNRAYEATVRETTLLAGRTMIRDRLVGANVPLSSLGLPESGVPTTRLLWLVDLDRCPACLGGAVAAWNALKDDTSLERHVVVVGDREVPPRARRGLRGTKFTWASRQAVYEVFGPLLPSTKLLVDRTNVVAMAESRMIDSDCAWSFEAQVGTVRGTFTSNLIRS